MVLRRGQRTPVQVVRAFIGTEVTMKELAKYDLQINKYTLQSRDGDLGTPEQGDQLTWACVDMQAQHGTVATG